MVSSCRHASNHSAEEQGSSPYLLTPCFRPFINNIDEAVPYLARRPEGACVEAVGPDATTTAEHSVDGLRQANGETLDSARERGAAVRLGENMHVV